MSNLKPFGRLLLGLTVVAGLCLLGHGVVRATPRFHAACSATSVGHAHCLASISTSHIPKPGKAALPASGSGYGPTQFHTAYQLPCTPDGPVAAVCSQPASFGPQTIAIVDAGSYSDPSGADGTVESALQTYDSFYGLPACSIANGCLSIVNQTGASSPLPANVSSGWSDEIALDVETAHMVCQTCKIVLLEANDDLVSNLAAAEATAAAMQPVAISNSWDATSDASGYDSDFEYTGIAVVAATGDNGSVTSGQSWPADIPQVVAASGTTLQLNGDNTWSSETVWSGSGGGCSSSYSAPSWQTARSDWATQGCTTDGRSFADVSADGDPNTGAAIVIGSSWYIMGGTSLATPLIASMYALGNDLPSSTQAVTVPYKQASATTLHDIITGNDCLSTGQPSCTAQSGFDTPSGLGSPKSLALLQDHSPADINKDGSINLLDFSTLASKFGQSGNNLGRADIDHNGQVNLLDFSLLASKFGQSD